MEHRTADHTKEMEMHRLIALLSRHPDILLPCRSSRWSNSGWVTPASQFPRQFEITFALSGERHATMRGKRHSFHPGDFHFHDCEEACRCHQGKFSYSYIIFTLDRTHPAYPHMQHSFADHFRRLHVVGKDDYALPQPKIEELFLRVSQELIARPEWFSTSATLLLIQLLIELQRSMKTKRHPEYNRYAKYSAIVADVIAYLEEHLDQDIDLDRLESRYRLNSRYLNRLFKGVTGKPIFQYQKTLKIEKAKKLLQNHSMSLTDIALELGMSSSQYFSYFFKKYAGIPPKQYRSLSAVTSANESDTWPESN